MVLVLGLTMRASADDKIIEDKFVRSDLQMYLQECLHPDVLAKMDEQAVAAPVQRLAWPGAPLQSSWRMGGYDCRVRFEAEFMVLLLQSPGPVAREGESGEQSVRRVTTAVLGAGLALDPPEAVTRDRQGREGAKMAITREPEKLDQGTVVAGYYDLARRSLVVSRVDVLIHRSRAVIIMEKSIPRTRPPRVFEGIEAAKEGLAQNLVFEEGQVPELPPTLLNGCLWPTDRVASRELEPLRLHRPDVTERVGGQ
jgi:hypothetical protein